MSDHDTVTPTETYSLLLRAVPGWRIPVDVRLRHLLRRALRDWGLRCIRIAPVPETEKPTNE
jgi:hypothetical protein